MQIYIYTVNWQALLFCAKKCGTGWVDRWVNGCVDWWMDWGMGGQFSQVKDCLHQSKIDFFIENILFKLKIDKNDLISSKRVQFIKKVWPFKSKIDQKRCFNGIGIQFRPQNLNCCLCGVGSPCQILIRTVWFHLEP